MESLVDNLLIVWEELKSVQRNVIENRKNGRRLRRRGKNFLWDKVKWRLAGIGLFAVTIPVVKALEGDATIALLTVPLGIYMMSGKTSGRKYE